ncbi:MAG: replicative DNA helicase [Phycisphaerales bacterium]
MDAVGESRFNRDGRGRGRGGAGPGVSAQRLFEKDPPRSVEAEMSLLGSMILDPRMIADVLSHIKSGEDFYTEAHGHIFRALVEVYDARSDGDLVMLQDTLRSKNQLELIGGDDYLRELAEAVPSAANAKHYARIVAEKAKLRRLIDAAGQILYDAYHSGDLGPEGAKEVLDKAETMVFDIAQEQESADPQSLSELLDAEMQRIEAADFDGTGGQGVKTSYHELDKLLAGLQPGELIIVAARPSMGKTALALNMAEQISIGGVPVPGAAATRSVPTAIFSLEMGKNALVQRMLSARSGVSSQMLRGGHRIPDDDFRRLLEAADDLKNAPVYIDDTPNLTVLSLRARARRMVAQHGVKVIMIDYLQLMTAPGAARESRQVEVSAISRGVKALARELNVPVICLSQLNRASEQREGNRPRMSDLRESGSIEQDADVIILLHREEYYHVQNQDWAIENPTKVGMAELIIAKQRNGPTGIVELKWDNRRTRFMNYDATAMEPHSFGGGGLGGAVGGGSMMEARPSGPASGYSSPSHAAQSFGSPFEPGSVAFSPGKKTGPVSGFRDGGGPDADEEMGGDDLGLPT